ncbi:hypothetical protein ACIQ9P_03805 [Kitasatospora sp. NPDC094019]|uniref:hypothetical protein n=1 Tax=Kitasatospora sp. NPDC094019 TaxID=3364091 RepID=UPI0037F49818
MLDFIVALLCDIFISLTGHVGGDAIGQLLLHRHRAAHELPAPDRRHPTRQVAHLHRVVARYRAARRLPARTALDVRVVERSRRSRRRRIVNRRRPGGRRA